MKYRLYILLIIFISIIFSNNIVEWRKDFEHIYFSDLDENGKKLNKLLYRIRDKINQSDKEEELFLYIWMAKTHYCLGNIDSSFFYKNKISESSKRNIGLYNHELSLTQKENCENDVCICNTHLLETDNLEFLESNKFNENYTNYINSFDSKDHVVIPGLINAHTHAAMSLLRGFASDMPLEKWLNEHIWPAEKKWVSEEFVKDGVELAIGEMLRTGVTCFNDMYFFPEVTAHVASKIGMRACVGMIVMEFP